MDKIRLVRMTKNEVSKSINIRDNRLGSESDKQNESVSNSNGFPLRDTYYSNDAFESVISLFLTRKDYVEFECQPDSLKFC